MFTNCTATSVSVIISYDFIFTIFFVFNLFSILFLVTSVLLLIGLSVEVRGPYACVYACVFTCTLSRVRVCVYLYVGMKDGVIRVSSVLHLLCDQTSPIPYRRRIIIKYH